MIKKMVRLDDENHNFVTLLAEARNSTIQKQVNVILRQYAPNVSKKLLERTRKSIGG